MQVYFLVMISVTTDKDEPRLVYEDHNLNDKTKNVSRFLAETYIISRFRPY